MDIIKDFISRYFKIIVSVVVAIIVIIILFSVFKKGGDKSEDVVAGVEFLKAQEAKSPDDVDKILNQQRQAKFEAERAAKKKQLESGEVDVWSLFSNSVILGDSRAMGFSAYQFLPESRVLAGKGDTILDIETHLEELKLLNPENVFLCYGLNDTISEMWDNNSYAAQYKEILEKVHAAVPNAKIYINSILPCTDGAIASRPSFGNTPGFSEATHVMAEQSGYGWIACDDLVSEHYDLFDSDGVHMVADFYPYWATQMMMTVYDSQYGAIATEGDATSADPE